MTITRFLRWLFDREFFIYIAGSCAAYAMAEFESHHLLAGLLLIGASLACWFVRRTRPIVDRLFESDPDQLANGIYWVWYDSEWCQGYWDGEDWDVRGATFSHSLPVGPRWTVPEKPHSPPAFQG